MSSSSTNPASSSFVGAQQPVEGQQPNYDIARRDQTENLDARERGMQDRGVQQPQIQRPSDESLRGIPAEQLYQEGVQPGQPTLANQPKSLHPAYQQATQGYATRDLPQQGSRVLGGASRTEFKSTGGLPGFFEVPEWETVAVHSQQVHDYDEMMNLITFTSGSAPAEAARTAERLPDVMHRRNSCLTLCLQALADSNKLKIVNFLTDSGDADRDYVRGSLQEGGYLRKLIADNKITSAGITSNYLQPICEKGWTSVLVRPGDFVWLGNWRVANEEAAHRHLPRLTEQWARQLGAMSSFVFHDASDQDYVWVLHHFTPGNIDHAATVLEDIVKNPAQDAITSGALVPPIVGGFHLVTHSLDQNGLAILPYENLSKFIGTQEKMQGHVSTGVTKVKGRLGH